MVLHDDQFPVPAVLHDELIVLRRPHFRSDGYLLYFLISERPYHRLSDLECEIWEAIARPTSLADLRKQFSGRADLAIQEFLRLNLCELGESVFPASRRQVLVIEPHADDAALSVGGAMWLCRHECAFTLATMASRTNYTSYYNLGRDFLNVQQVMSIRRRESELFVRILGGQHLDVGLTDAVLRYRDADWSVDFFNQHRTSISVATSRRPDLEERNRWTQSVRKLLDESSSEEVWFPLGGPHTDHLLTLTACIDAFVSAPALMKGRVLRVYQDVPYAARFPDFTSNAVEALSRLGVQLDPKPVLIKGVFEQKLRLASIYASQFKIRALRKDIEDSARIPGAERGLVESMWTIRGMPDQISRFATIGDSVVDRRRIEVAESWLSRNFGAERVRVLLLIPTGRWSNDLNLLCEALPHARFEVFAAPAAMAEVSEVISSRVQIRRVSAGSRAWAMLALKLAAARRQPTIFHAGEKRLHEASWLSRLWVGSDTLVLESMNSLVSGLEHRLVAPVSDRGRQDLG